MVNSDDDGFTIVARGVGGVGETDCQVWEQFLHLHRIKEKK